MVRRCRCCEGGCGEGGWCGGEGGWHCGEDGWWLALWRRWLVVGIVVKVVGGWRCGLSKITIVKEKRLPQRSQPCYTDNSL